MASASTQENTNFARLCDLLDDVGCTVLRDTFDSIHTPANLQGVLSSPSVLSTLHSLRNRRALSSSQWKKLFPTIATSVSSANFDVPLLIVLLTNICDLSPPVSTGNWDHLPPDSDTTAEASIVRIKCYRDEVFANISEASIDDSGFIELWQKISSAIQELAPGTNKAMYETAMKQLKTDGMDPVAGALYSLKEMLEELKGNQERANERLVKIEGNQERANERLVKIEGNQERAKEQLSKFEGNQERAIEQISKGIKEVLKLKPCERPAEECLNYGEELPAEDHIKVLKERIGGMSVFELPGIGKALGTKLKEKGFGLVKDVLQEFLRLDGDEQKFLAWIRKTCGANRKQGGDCYRWLREQCDAPYGQPQL